MSMNSVFMSDNFVTKHLTSLESRYLISYVRDVSCEFIQTMHILKYLNDPINKLFKYMANDLTKTSSWFTNYQSRRYAGHSHWKNIKATKEMKDAQKQKTFGLVVRKIKIAVQEGNGSTNPKLNPFLAKVLEEAKSKDIPSSTITAALQRLDETKVMKGPQIFVEGRALSGCSIIVESFTEKPKWFRQNVQHILKIYGGRIAEAGSCSHLFDYKGVIYVSGSSSDNSTVSLNHDKAFELALDAGAEEVIEDTDENNETIFKFICETRELHQVKKSLLEQSLHPYDAKLEYIPHTFVTVGDENLEVASKFINDLESLEDASQVFHNIQAAQAVQS